MTETMNEDLIIANPNINQTAMGGTELVTRGLYKHADRKTLERVNIIPSRVRMISAEKPNILVLHDLAEDPEVQHLKDANHRKLFNLVCVSEWQKTEYNAKLGIPLAEMTVIRNSIEEFNPDDYLDKRYDSGPIRLIYHTTPHRGLEILIPVFEHLWDKMGYAGKIHLDLCSSFNVYGWGERDKPYQNLFDRADKHPGITNHGALPNAKVRELLKDAHIFAYPSIWKETSCIAAIEAMASATAVVAPNYAALAETCRDSPFIYRHSAVLSEHANIFARSLADVIGEMRNLRLGEERALQLKNLARRTNNLYGWKKQSQVWNEFLDSTLSSRIAV